MTTPPAGWYPDPAVAQTQRYWDGHNWTEHVAPFSPAERALSRGELRRAAILRARWPPIAAGWAGVASLVAWLVPVLGLVVGSVAAGLGAGVLMNSFANGRGRVRGAFALVVGFVSLMVSAAGLGDLLQ